MASKPTIADSRWATDGGAELDAPTSGDRDSGFVTGTDIVSDHHNVLLKEAYKWHQWLDDGDVDLNDVTCASLDASGQVDAASVVTATATIGAATVTGAATIGGAATLNGTEILGSVISPTALPGGNVDNWSPTGLSTARIIRMSGSGTLNGLVAQGAGRVVTLINVGASSITLVDESSNTAANRFLCPNATNITVTVQSSVTVWYDGTSSRWRVIAESV